jgi:hypothetical protein
MCKFEYPRAMMLKLVRRFFKKSVSGQTLLISLWFAAVSAPALSQSADLNLGTLSSAKSTLINSDQHIHQLKKVGGIDAHVFSKAININGRALFYWDLEFGRHKSKVPSLDNLIVKRRLSMRFYPDASTQQVLPNFLDSENSKTSRVFIYLGDIGATAKPVDLSDPKQASAGLRSQIKNIVGNKFLNERTGYVTKPVNISLDGLFSVFEANHRFVYARPNAIKLNSSDTSTNENLKTDLSDGPYLSMPWAKYFEVKNSLSLRDRPSLASATSTTLQVDQRVELIAIGPNGWALVRQNSAQAGQPSVEGYVKANNLWLID